MYIRRYSIGAVLYMIFVSWFIYAFITTENTPENLNILGQNIAQIPLALAFIVPLIFLFLLTVGHMLFYSFVEHLRNIQNERDFQELEKAVKYNLMGEFDQKHNYSSKLYRDIGELLNNVKIEPKDELNISNKSKFKSLMTLFENLKKGEVVELKQYSSFLLDEKNARNELKKDIKVAEKLLSERGIYTDKLYYDAFVELVKIAPFHTIEKHIEWLSKDAFWELFKRIEAPKSKKLHLSKEDVLMFVSKLKFNAEDYTTLAKIMKQENIAPETRLEFFKAFLDRTDDSMEGYLYTLFDLEMISEAKTVLQEAQPNEFTNMRAYLLLKGSNFNSLDLDFFIKAKSSNSKAETKSNIKLSK
jgi:hypothetical protein